MKRPSGDALEVRAELISSGTGEPIWQQRIVSDSADSFLEQSRLATQIASSLGFRLTATADQSSPPSAESFACLVDGETRSDPDSVDGLVKALECFQHAHQADLRLADPLAGIALTSVTLAAQSSERKSLDLIAQARKSAADALKLNPASIKARLALAALDWQTTNRYQQAERSLRELAMVNRNDWQVLHQYALLKLALGESADAARLLRQASQLNPMSLIVKVDRARARWFAGNVEAALEEAARIRDRYQPNLMARGLLVDIYEQQQRWDGRRGGA